MIRKIAILVFCAVALAGSVWMHYCLPSKQIVMITGTDAKRAENLPTRTTSSTVDASDVFYVYIKTAKDKNVVFKNENTGWGWPPYFKFDATELQAKAQNAKDELVLITYYGWRNKLVGLFPNMVELEKAAPGASTVSWPRRIIFSAWFLFLIWLFSRYIRLFPADQ